MFFKVKSRDAEYAGESTISTPNQARESFDEEESSSISDLGGMSIPDLRQEDFASATNTSDSRFHGSTTKLTDVIVINPVF